MSIEINIRFESKQEAGLFFEEMAERFRFLTHAVDVAWNHNCEDGWEDPYQECCSGCDDLDH